MPSAHAADTATAPSPRAADRGGDDAGNLADPRVPAPRRYCQRPPLLTLVDERGHYCETWALRDGTGDYRCACPGIHVVPAEGVSDARVSAAAVYLMQHLEPEDGVVTWQRPEKYETLVDPLTRDRSDTFFYHQGRDAWVSAEGLMIPAFLYERAQYLAGLASPPSGRVLPART